MKLKPAQFSLPTIIQKYKAALFFGPDAGQAEDLAKKTVAAVVPTDDAFLKVRLTMESIKENPSRINEEAGAISLIGGRRVIEIRGAEASLADSLSFFLDRQNTDTFIVLTADNLTPANALRKLAESHQSVACFACYPEDERSMRQIMTDYLASAGKNISPDALAFLQSHTGTDRRIMLSELDKLVTYAFDKQTITLEDVQASSGDTSEASLDKLINGIVEGKHTVVQGKLPTLFLEGQSEVAILRIVSSYFQKLLQIHTSVNAGMRLEEALSHLYPRLNFKTEPLFRRHLMHWKEPDVIRALDLLIKAETDCKNASYVPSEICAHCLLLLTHAGSRLFRN